MSDVDSAAFARLGTLHDTSGQLVWSVLVIDVQEAHVEGLVTKLEAQGFFTEAILRDPDDDHVYFVQVSENRIHTERSFVARAAELRAWALEHDARVADWSARDARLSNRP